MDKNKEGGEIKEPKPEKEYSAFELQIYLGYQPPKEEVVQTHVDDIDLDDE